jgi:hypothetical protein
MSTPEPPPDRLRPRPEKPLPESAARDAAAADSDEEHPDFSAEYDHQSGRLHAASRWQQEA